MADKLRTIIITGLAGAGKSTALKVFEDMGYYAIDNLPVFLLKPLLDQADQRLQQKQPALVMDCRDPGLLSTFEAALPQIRTKTEVEILFLDADIDTLLTRFSQLRRKHPQGENCTIRQAIVKEKEVLQPIMKLASATINTSKLSPHELGRQLRRMYGTESSSGKLTVNIFSFGFKHGPPADAESLWDVRFLPNPYFVPELKAFTGQDERVASYVLENETSRNFFDLLKPMLTFLIPKYQEEGKAQLTIGIGCTGGKHRSVAVTEKIREILSTQNITLLVEHRDIDK